MLIADIRDSEISALTRTLQLLPDENAVSYAGRVMSSISALSSHLKRCSRVSAIIQPSQKLYAPLCKLHKRLNAILIHALFNQVALEAGGRLNSLVSNNHVLTEIERARVQSLRELHSLWLAPEVYQKTFFELPDWQKWKYQADECEACMLSRIGGDMTILLNFRLALLSRMSSKKLRRYGPPRLLPWIERWITSLSTGMNLSPSAFEELISTNDADGFALKEIRKQLWHERREARRLHRAKSSSRRIQERDVEIATSSPANPTVCLSTAGTSDTSNQPYFEDGSDPSDAENELIDAYATLTSTPYLPCIASTVFLHQTPTINTSVVPLTRHPNGDIATKPAPSERPPPTNFNVVANSSHGQRRDHLNHIKPLDHDPPSFISQLPLNPPPPPNPTNRTSHYNDNDSNATSPADSYLPPAFSHHPAYTAPTASDHAQRYQTLLSPNPLLRVSEEELRIPATAQSSRASYVSLSSAYRASSVDAEDAEHGGISGGGPPTPADVRRDKAGSAQFVVGSVEPELEPELEPDWYDSGRSFEGLRRSRTVREEGKGRHASGKDGRRKKRRSRRDSGATDVTRMSDLFCSLMEEAKGRGLLGGGGGFAYLR